MRRILIIDDMHAIHEDFRKILTPGGASASLSASKAALFGAKAAAKAGPSREPFEVDSAFQGEEGWQKVRDSVAAGKPYALAFVDMRMPPGWDGLKTIQRLWEEDANLQVVICTAYSDHSWDEISESLGLTDKLLILKKPFDPIEAIQLATALCEKWELSRKAVLKLDELEQLVQKRTTEITRLAMHDRLTGLPNRAMLREKLSAAVQASTQLGAPGFALLFLDFDRFKAVNDTLGHEAGDQLLIEIGRRMTACLGSGDCAALAGSYVAARMGGDEFVVLVEQPQGVAAASAIADALLKALATPYMLGTYSLSTTASIGITTSDLGYHTADEVIRDADTAMYHAKAAGKACAVMFDRSMHDATRQRLELERDLGVALKENQFELHYQPIVNLTTGAIVGFEALARWNHPVKGLVAPDSFIPCAEDAGLILKLGEWVLGQAVRQLKAWHEQFPSLAHLTVSVNVSTRQLNSGQLLGQLASVLGENNLPPDRLALEITESGVMADTNFTSELLRKVRKLGVRLYMDDFGTGYSSLSYVHLLPLDAIKMDRSFLASVEGRRDYASIVHAIINLTHNLGIGVIAEGIETQEQLALLQSMECGFGQGYLFGKPANVEATTKLLSKLTVANRVAA